MAQPSRERAAGSFVQLNFNWIFNGLPWLPLLRPAPSPLSGCLFYIVCKDSRFGIELKVLLTSSVLKYLVTRRSEMEIPKPAANEGKVRQGRRQACGMWHAGEVQCEGGGVEWKKLSWLSKNFVKAIYSY